MSLGKIRILAYRAVETLFCLNQRKSSIFTLTKFASAAPLARPKVHWSLMELSDRKDEPTESTPDFQLFKKNREKPVEQRTKPFLAKSSP